MIILLYYNYERNFNNKIIIDYNIKIIYFLIYIMIHGRIN